MKKWLIWLSLVCISGCIISDSRSSFTIWNDSNYVIEEIYLSPSESNNWGPDLLGADVLFPDEEITIDFIECGYYDVLVVDEYAAECTLDGINLCFDDKVWRITDATLATCEY